MTRHVSYRGITIDMESMRRENEKTPAIGNMPVNARGDQISGGKVVKTADQLAREYHRVQSAILTTGLKGPVEKEVVVETTVVAPTPVQATKTKTKEVELPSGDIIIEGDASAN